MRQVRFLFLGVTLFARAPVFAQPPVTRVNPMIREIVDQVSEERIAGTLKKLESFGTRYVLSPQDDAKYGIGAAQRWLVNEFRSYSPRLDVKLNGFHINKGPRLSSDADLNNVIAVLPGKTHPERYVVVSAHYDSLNLIRQKTSTDTDEERASIDAEATARQKLAPGVTDDGSGTAAVLELARIMSRYEFDKSIMFIAFSAEEVGLLGSKAYAAEAKEKNMGIEAVLNNDVIGSTVSGNGRQENGVVKVYSDGPEDSESRSVARYIKEIGERYVPAMRVGLVFRRDRFGRAGDHTSFTDAGFPAVRVTTPAENYSHQHNVTDTFQNTSTPYIAKVAKMNAAVLASIALAPEAPVLVEEVRRNSGLWRVPMLTRGKSGYDAVLRWKLPDSEPDLAGYAIEIRDTTAPVWEREIYVGNVDRYTIKDLSIDDVVIGVRAIDKDGNASVISAYLQDAKRIGD